MCDDDVMMAGGLFQNSMNSMNHSMSGMGNQQMLNPQQQMSQGGGNQLPPGAMGFNQMPNNIYHATDMVAMVKSANNYAPTPVADVPRFDMSSDFPALGMCWALPSPSALRPSVLGVSSIVAAYSCFGHLLCTK